MRVSFDGRLGGGRLTTPLNDITEIVSVDGSRRTQRNLASVQLGAMELPRSRRDGDGRRVAGDTEYQAREEWEQELHCRKGNPDAHVGVCCENAVPGK